MEAQELRGVALRWLALWSPGGLGPFEGLHAESFVDHSPGPRPPTRAGFKTGIEALVAAFPDFKWAAEDILVDASASKVAVRWTAEGTHIGAYLGYAATGRRVSFAGIEIIRVEEGRVTDRWGEWDADSLRGQLGSNPK
jgi:steroid delta-isomerase-like uncharacterized protein